MEKWTRIGAATLLSGLAVLLAGCGDDAGDLAGPSAGARTGTVTLSVASGSPGSGTASTALAPSFAVTRTDGSGNELVLDSVQLVLREIELERAFEDDCPDEGQFDDDDDCEEFEAGIRLLELPLDGSVETLIAIDAPAGTYDELEFEIHKPDDDEPEDREFLEQHPEFRDVSIRVKGTFNGEEFLFLQDLNEDQEREMNPPLVVEEGGEPVNVTLMIDVSTWFTSDGTPTGSLIDPRTANKGGANENLVEENIENSIEAFEDDDVDGDDDEEEEDDRQDDDGDDDS